MRKARQARAQAIVPAADPPQPSPPPEPSVSPPAEISPGGGSSTIGGSGSVVADGAPAAVLTEAAIATHYGATIDVVPVGGRIAVVPRRAPAEEHLDGPPLVREAARRSADPPS